MLLTARDGGIATFTLNRPGAMNALSRELRAALAHAFRCVADDADVGVVILTGRGRAFCAGLDLKELGGESGGSPGAMLEEQDLIAAMRACPLPIVGAINGFAITGGFELALACDVLVASSEARFADTHARVGIVPGWGLSQLLPRRVGTSRAKELSFTGNYLDAGRALAWGLVNSVVAPDELLPACGRLAADMLSCDRATLREIKRIYDAGYATTLADGLQLEARTSREHARSVSPESVAKRRRGVQERGRSQSR
ncbi:MAG: enoyl-CoA hydratase [Proteobacteria bacterium]|nr:MAG: enoyl-CoA hydratase [Pseudomonadota bacterium]